MFVKESNKFTFAGNHESKSANILYGRHKVSSFVGSTVLQWSLLHFDIVQTRSKERIEREVAELKDDEKREVSHQIHQLKQDQEYRENILKEQIKHKTELMNNQSKLVGKITTLFTSLSNSLKKSVINDSQSCILNSLNQYQRNKRAKNSSSFTVLCKLQSINSEYFTKCIYSFQRDKCES